MAAPDLVRILETKFVVADKILTGSVFMKFTFTTLLVTACSFFLLLAPNTLLAAERLTINNATGFLDKTIAPTGLEKTDIGTSVARIIKGILGTVGLLFFVLMVYGGILWMTDRGKEEQIAKAKNTIIAAVIGMAVVTAAYAITNFVASKLIDKAGGSPPVQAGDVGGSSLGCCVLETGPGINACRIDTERECKRRADAFRDSNESSGAWNWQNGVNAVECNKQC